jgi:hypothetical protein
MGHFFYYQQIYGESLLIYIQADDLRLINIFMSLAPKAGKFMIFELMRMVVT